MQRGQTPKQRRFRKETKPFSKAVKTLSWVLGTAASKRGLRSEKMKDLLKEAKMKKPSGRISKDDLKRVMQKGPRPMQKKLGDIPMGKGPNKMDKQKTPMQKTLAPVRSIRERAKQSRLVGGKSKFTKPKR